MLPARLYNNFYMVEEIKTIKYKIKRSKKYKIYMTFYKSLITQAICWEKSFYFYIHITSETCTCAGY